MGSKLWENFDNLDPTPAAHLNPVRHQLKREELIFIVGTGPKQVSCRSSLFYECPFCFDSKLRPWLEYNSRGTPLSMSTFSKKYFQNSSNFFPYEPASVDWVSSILETDVSRIDLLPKKCNFQAIEHLFLQCFLLIDQWNHFFFNWL